MPGTLMAQAISVNTIAGPFNGAGDLAVDDQGNIFVADFFSSLITQVTPDGQTSTFVNNGINGASGNEFDTQGNLYQSNFAGDQISVISQTGQISVFANSNQGISGPVGITLDSNGVVFVANCGNNTITQHTGPNQGSLFASGALFNCPNGMTVDTQNNIYVANFNNGNVIRITPQGSATILATIPGNNNGHITFVNGVLYVVALADHRIYRLELDGSFAAISGSGVAGNSDGSGSTATHFRPNGIDHSPDGRILYVNDVEFPKPNGVANPNLVREIVISQSVFSINAGLNDAWFNVDTGGQGFFIVVFPELGKVFLAWFTFDTQRPDPSVTAMLGEPGHRWLTAFGDFMGDTASLAVEITSGGIFDSGQPAVIQASDGTITLHFTDCENGTVSYDIPSINLQGNVPIQRLAPDNVARCETLSGMSANR